MKADDRTRTDNLLITNQLLCQLSHIGIYIKEGPTKWEDSLISHARFAKQTLMRAFAHCKKWMGPTGLEPVTLCL